MYIRWIYLCKHRAVYGKSLHLIFSAAATAAAEKRKPRTEQMHQQTNDVSETRFILLSYMPWTSSLLISAHISVAAIFSRTHFIIACLLILQLWLKKDKNNSIWFASANSFKPEIHLVWLLHYMGLSLGLVSCFVFDFTYFAVLLFLLLPFLPFRSFRVFGYHITYSWIRVHYVIKSKEREWAKKLLQLKCFVFNFDGITLELQALRMSINFSHIYIFVMFVCGLFFLLSSPLPYIEIARHFAEHCLHYICF